MHKKDLAHRDLKPENIVFKANDTNQPMLIDFGDAERARDDKTYTEFVGTPPYMSPERLDEHKGWQLKKADIWAVAVIAYEMYCGHRCFQGDSQKKVFGKILRGEWQWPSDRKPSQNMQDFISQCLNQDASLRPSAKEALSHTWFDKKRKEEEKQTKTKAILKENGSVSKSETPPQQNKLVDNVSDALSIDEEQTKVNYKKIKPGNITDPIIKIKDITQRQQKTDGCIKLFENLASMVESNALQNILVKLGSDSITCKIFI